MKKHAFIIMAHNNLYCLEKLIQLLDDPRNNIFLHIDAKVKDFDFGHFRNICKKAALIYPKKRIDVRWGTQSQVKTEMLMLQTAASYGPHHYYHILSGSDMPLQSQDKLHNWFYEKTSSYLYYTENPSLWDIQRITRYHNVFGQGNPISIRLNGLFSGIQKTLSIDRLKKTGIVVQKGSNWGSLTQQAVDILLANESLIMKMTRFSVCADEVYKQTILLHNGSPVVKDDLRLIIWDKGIHPHTFVSTDYELLCKSDRFFARKFSDKIDRHIIDMIDKKVRCDSE